MTLLAAAVGALLAVDLPAARLELQPVEGRAFDVALTVATPGAPVFRLEDSVMGSAGMAALIANATASDENGELPLSRRESGGVLELRALRRAKGPVTLRYRANSVATSVEGARHGLRHDESGLGGLGSFFLVLPETTRLYRTTVQWGGDPGHQVFSSFGFGREAVETVGPLSQLRMAAYFSGRPRVVLIDEGRLHLRFAWFGTALDVEAASAWAAKTFAAERSLFSDESTTPYTVFVRTLPSMGERSNGVGQLSSLMLAIGPQTPFGPRLRTNLAHEMLHRWLGLTLRLAGPEGSAYWFTEGFTVYWAATVLRQAGLISRDECLAELDTIAKRHSANPYAKASNDEIRLHFFENDQLSVVPYTRGALYAAELDAEIERASGHSRSLLDVMKALYWRALFDGAADEQGFRPVAVSAFREAVVRELGRPGGARFDAVILRGEGPVPVPEASQCLARSGRRSISAEHDE